MYSNRIRPARMPGVASTGDSFNSDEWGFNHPERKFSYPRNPFTKLPSPDEVPATDKSPQRAEGGGSFVKKLKPDGKIAAGPQRSLSCRRTENGIRGKSPGSTT